MRQHDRQHSRMVIPHCSNGVGDSTGALSLYRFRVWTGRIESSRRSVAACAPSVREGGCTVMRKPHQVYLSLLLICFATIAASAQNPQPDGQSFRVQCPTATPLHPAGTVETPYKGPVSNTVTITPQNGAPSFALPYVSNGGAVKCQEISGGDGYMTEADGNQTFMFAFAHLSGMNMIKNGQPGTLLNTDFNNFYNSPTLPNGCNSDAPSTCGPMSTDPTYKPAKPVSLDGAVVDPAAIMTIGVMNGNLPMPLAAFDEDDEFFLTLTNVGMIMRPDLFEQHTVHFHGYPNASSFYEGVPDP